MSRAAAAANGIYIHAYIHAYAILPFPSCPFSWPALGTAQVVAQVGMQPRPLALIIVTRGWFDSGLWWWVAGGWQLAVGSWQETSLAQNPHGSFCFCIVLLCTVPRCVRICRGRLSYIASSPKTGEACMLWRQAPARVHWSDAARQ